MTHNQTETRCIRSKYCTLTPKGMIEIQPNGERDETYRIRLDEIDTLLKLHDWIRHLANRTGYTNEVIGDLVTLHARHCGLFREDE